MSVESHLQTFCHRERKKMPDILNWFGWCTWDAFYTDVTSDGLRQGLESLENSGTPPKFVIIDDGWQSVAMEPTSIKFKSDNSANFANRLINIKENYKFHKERENAGVRSVCHLHTSYLVNSVCHIWGTLAWNTGDVSKK